MDKLRKNEIFSGKDSDMIDKKRQANHNIYCESQDAIDNSTIKEENEGREEVKAKESKMKRFVANYNMFF